jgi:arylsulfatase A-like enzyme
MTNKDKVKKSSVSKNQSNFCENMNRRQFVKRGAAALLAATMIPSNPTVAAPIHVRKITSGRKNPPNIVFIVVDEMRFPMNYPGGITSACQFFYRFMPNVGSLWDKSVKFANHYTAATACSPSRAALITGLYPHQNWNLLTPPGTVTPGESLAPALESEFPTYGKILRNAGYRTPYIGKWHLSGSPARPSSPDAFLYLESYGFNGLTIPDVTGLPGQGIENDPMIAKQAINWLSQQKAGLDPFCLTVSLVNPHDKQFFWGGTEAATYNQLFTEHRAKPLIPFTPYPGEENPPQYGYAALPENWEPANQLASNKPGCQHLIRMASGLLCGDASDDPAVSDFALADLPGYATLKIAVAPFRYWQRSLDSYTQLMSFVDDEIGNIVNSIPKDILDNTIIILTSDHGDYAGAHGILSGKEGTMYEECIKVPLIVFDPQYQFTGDIDIVRYGLTSSVDVLPMMVSLAYGNREWMKEDYAAVYSERLDMLPILKNCKEKTRSQVLMASDEWKFNAINFNNVPCHILGTRTPDLKVASYTHWDKSGDLVTTGMEVESYDFKTKNGQLELDNFNCETDKAQKILQKLNLSSQMRAPLPKRWLGASNRAKARYLAHISKPN